METDRLTLVLADMNLAKIKDIGWQSDPRNYTDSAYVEFSLVFLVFVVMESHQIFPAMLKFFFFLSLSKCIV